MARDYRYEQDQDVDATQANFGQSGERWVYAKGKSIEEALAKAVSQLGVSEEQLDIEVVRSPQSRILAFLGLERAVVKASTKRPEADDIRSVLEGLLDLLGAQPLDIRVQSENSTIKVRMELGPDAGLVIGKNGLTLDALEHLVQKAARSRWGYRESVELDVQGYKRRRRRQWKRRLSEAIKAFDQGSNRTVMVAFPRADQEYVANALSGHHRIEWHIVGRGFYRILVLRSNKVI